MEKRTFIAAAALVGIAHCPAAWPQDKGSPPAPSNVIHTGFDMPYANPKAIDPAIFRECFLPVYGAEHLVLAVRKAGLDIDRDDDAVKAGKGRVLQVKIVGTYSLGGSYLDVHKGVEVMGRLTEDGKQIGNFAGRRDASSGALGFKGTCSALKLSLDALAGDIALWLKNLDQNAR